MKKSNYGNWRMAALRIVIAIVCWWAWSSVGIAAWAYYNFPGERGCMIEYVRSWESAGVIYHLPKRGWYATHVEPASVDLPISHELVPIGVVDGCAYRTGDLVIDFPNTVFCWVARTLETYPETRRESPLAQ